ncbi:MAG TPA: ABC transporter ATP-binding protein [Chloroflexota bacterium]|nr:ABC transporter ATP-binding protein [Chloroflexota bacterium]
MVAVVKPTAPTTTHWAVETAALTRRYGTARALNRLDLTIPWDQRLAILGPNGAGKTTFLRIVATLVRPTSGRITVGGLELPGQAAAVRRHIGLVSHQTFLYDELTARENLLFYGRLHRVPNPRDRADLLLERVGLADRADDRVRTFSRGLQQRLALARAVVHDPSILLLDEPDTGLDVAGLDLLSRLAVDESGRRRTVLLTTHDLQRAIELSDRVVVFANGMVILDRAAERLNATILDRAIRGETFPEETTL